MHKLFLYAPFALVPFAVQLAVLFATRRRFRPLRIAVPILVGVAGVAFLLLCCLTAPPGWGILLFPLAAVICVALGELALVGYGLAWFVYSLIDLIKRKGKPVHE